SGRRASIASARSAAAGSSTPEYERRRQADTHHSRLRSFDDLVGTGQHRLRNRQPERLGRLEVNYELELGGLLDGKIRRLRTSEDSVDVCRHATLERRDTGSV